MTIKERRNFLNLSDRQTNRQIDRQKNDKSVESQTNILYRLNKRPERQTGGKSFD